MARPKGYKLSDERKQKMKEGRIATRQSKALDTEPTVRPIVSITGEEKTGFDFWEPLRNSLRPLHLYMFCKKLEKLVVDKAIWQNTNSILNLLSKKVDLVVKGQNPVRVKKTKTSRKPLTEEQKEKLRANLAKARLALGTKGVIQ